MRIFLSLALMVSGALLLACSDEANRGPEWPLRLWYEKPASEWEQALPLGNGRLGVMVFGGTGTERIQLNDDSMWPGDPGWDQPAGTPDDLERIREHIMEGRIPSADRLMVEKFSRKGVTRSHQTLGDLFIEFDQGDISDYRRELDLHRAVATVSYKVAGQPVTEKVFVSHPHRAIVIRLRSEAEGGLNARIRMSRPEDEGFSTARAFVTEGKQLVMEGMVTQRGGQFDSKDAPILEGVSFASCLKADHADGEVLAGPDYLEMKQVKEATLYLVSNSSWYHEDYREQNRKDLEALD